MVNADRSTDIFHDPRSLPNRIAGIVFLVFFLPVLLVVSAALLARGGNADILATATLPGARGGSQTTRLLQFNAFDDTDALDRFLLQSRLNLLPRLINVARGDIPIFNALQ